MGSPEPVSPDSPTDTELSELLQDNTENKLVDQNSVSSQNQDQPTSAIKNLIGNLEEQKLLIRPKEYTRKPADTPSGDRTDSTQDAAIAAMPSSAEVTLPVSEVIHSEPEVKQKVTAPSEPGVIEVLLYKPESGGLGFSLVHGERGGKEGVFIKTITEGGVAEAEGRLCVGDRLIQVNGESVVGMPHKMVVGLLRNASGTVSLVISRPPSTQDSTEESPFKSQKHESKEQDNLATLASHEPQSELTDDEDDDREGLLQAFIDSVKPAIAKDGKNKISVLSQGSSGNQTVEEVIDFTTDELEKFNLNFRTESSKAKSKNESHILDMLSDDWLNAQPIVQVPADSVLYRDQELATRIKYLQTQIENDEPMDEYKCLRHAKLTDNCSVARRPENKNINRYRNVLPYDATRVILSRDEDYINASHIRVATGKGTQHFIAAQGPQPNTTEDFWGMIWEQKVQVVVMVTLDNENSKNKCHLYWPDSMSAPLDIENRYKISLLSVHSLADFKVRLIEMEDLESGESHCIYHLNFTTWPDHGAPDSAIPILKMIRFMRCIHERGPVVVHCSAGIGCTGALITIDCLLYNVEHDLKIDIPKLVQDIRRQRQGMIQTKDQYMFCYRAALQILECIDEA